MNWNIVINGIYCISLKLLSNSFMFDTIFRFDNIWGVLKYVIKS